MRISDQAYNRHKVLKTVRGDGPISRTELTGRTGLSGATITEVIGDLLRRGLVREERAGSGARGRPRIKVSIDPAGGLVIGAELRPDNALHTHFVDLAGSSHFSCKAQLGAPRTLAAFAARIADLLLEGISASPFEAGQISRIAIALPALIDSDTGVVHWMTTFNDGPYPFAAAISRRLGIPVTIENGSTGLARAEHWFGSAKSIDHFSLFHVDLWVDAAQYADGLPRMGGNGFNSEFGHVKVDTGADARRCLCGARGCVASYSSIYGILLGSGAFADFDVRTMPSFSRLFADLAERALRGESDAVKLFAAAAHHLGVVISDHINVFDPKDVFVLISDHRLLELVRPGLERSIRKNVFGPLLERTRIRIDFPTEDWRWKGAAAHALEQTYLRGGEPMVIPRGASRSRTPP
jgi:predicted NBD/HSP70 family sugar kinase